MPHRCIKSASDFDALGRLLSGLEYPYTVEWRKGVDRSLDQNALQWKWAGEAASQYGDRTAKEVQHEWKLRIGVPILLSENESFRQFAYMTLKPLAYEQRLQAMEFTPVSSIMTVKQMSEYMTQIQRECEANGIRLTVPGD